MTIKWNAIAEYVSKYVIYFKKLLEFANLKYLKKIMEFEFSI